MKAFAQEPGRPLGLLTLVTIAVVSAFCGYLVTETEPDIEDVVGGMLILGIGAVAWFGGDHTKPLADQTRSAERGREQVFRAPRLAFLFGLLLVGQLTIRPLYATTASDFVFAVALVATLVASVLYRRGDQGFLPAGVLAGAALFAAGACISAFSSDTGVASIEIGARFLYLTVAWFWVASVVLRTTRHVSLAVSFWMVSLSASSAAAIAQLLAGDVIPNTDIAFGRMTGTAQHVNDLGGSTAVALPAAIGLAFYGGAGSATRLLGVATTVLITTGLVLSGSVSGLLAAGIGITVAAWFGRRKLAIGMAALVIGLAILTIGVATPEEGATTLSERISEVRGSNGTVAARFDGFEVAWTRIGENPFVGVGFEFEPLRSGGDISDVIHNAFLNTWYQGGLLALIGLLFIIVSCLRAGVQATVGATTPRERMLAGSLVGSFAAYLAFGLAQPTLYVRYGWVPVALVLALRAVQRRRDGTLTAKSV